MGEFFPGENREKDRDRSRWPRAIAGRACTAERLVPLVLTPQTMVDFRKENVGPAVRLIRPVLCRKSANRMLLFGTTEYSTSGLEMIQPISSADCLDRSS
jgi:hypothetical protein